jgi:hypothetical protein
VENLDAIIGVPEDKDDFVIQIFAETSYFADIEREKGSLSIKIYNHRKLDCWDIDLNQLCAILEKAKVELETYKNDTP